MPEATISSISEEKYDAIQKMAWRHARRYGVDQDELVQEVACTVLEDKTNEFPVPSLEQGADVNYELWNLIRNTALRMSRKAATYPATNFDDSVLNGVTQSDAFGSVECAEAEAGKSLLVARIKAVAADEFAKTQEYYEKQGTEKMNATERKEQSRRLAILRKFVSDFTAQGLLIIVAAGIVIDKLPIEIFHQN